MAHFHRPLFLLIITVTVKTMTAQVSPSVCSGLKVTGPAGITQYGDAMVFRVESKIQSNLEELTFKWRVGDRQFSGQGTSQVRVPTTKRDANSTITAFVEVSDKSSSCSTYLSEQGSVAPALPNEVFDEFGALKPNDVRSRLDVLFTTLFNNLKYEGVLVLSFDESRSERYKLQKLNLIYGHIAFRKFDRTRLSFYLRRDRYEKTVVWQIPAGFDYSEIGIDETKLIKAEEFRARIKKALQK